MSTRTRHRLPGSRASNLYFKYKLSCVRADMTDSDLEQLSDGNGRMYTSLLGQRAMLQDPVLNDFCATWDHWWALYQQWRQTGEEEIWIEQDRAYRKVMKAIDRL
jgi:hypothetical protein